MLKTRIPVLLILAVGALCVCALPTTDIVVPEENFVAPLASPVASHWYDAARPDEAIPSDNTDFLETTMHTEIVPDDTKNEKVLESIAAMMAYSQLAYEKAKDMDDERQSSLVGFVIAFGGATDPDKVAPASPVVYNAAVLQIQTLYEKGIGKYLFDYVDSAVKAGEVVIGSIGTNRIGFQYKKLGLSQEPDYFQDLSVRATAYAERLAAIKAVPSPTLCCQAIDIPECMACAAGMSIKNFCAVNAKKCFPDMDIDSTDPGDDEDDKDDEDQDDEEVKEEKEEEAASEKAPKKAETESEPTTVDASSDDAEEAAGTASFPVNGGEYRLVNAHTSRALYAQDEELAEGVGASPSSGKIYGDSKWKTMLQSDGSWRIVNSQNSRVLYAEKDRTWTFGFGAGPKDGKHSADQTWNFVKNEGTGSETYRIVNAYSGRAVFAQSETQAGDQWTAGVGAGQKGGRHLDDQNWMVMPTSQ